MAIYTIKLIKKITVAEDTMGFFFEKPEGFSFRAGQFADYTLIDPPETDNEGNTHGFSLVHAPYEKYLGFATRMRDTAFKRTLKNLPLGTEIKLDAPYGDFVLHKTLSTPAVYLTGGIGITPVRSIIAQATYDQLEQQITLFYSNRTPQLAAFTEDLEGFARDNANFTFIPIMTQSKNPEWSGETGYITEEMLRRYVPDLQKPIYYISGPAVMVAAMRKILVEAAISEDNIRTEEFTGY